MKKSVFIYPVILLIACIFTFPCGAIESVDEAMDAVVTRLFAEKSPEELSALDNEGVLGFISPEERRVFATKYWYFDVNVPVTVSVIRLTGQKVIPFWVEEAGFRKTEMTVRDTNGWEYEVWQRGFEAGRVELGINGFDKERCVYFVCVGPRDAADKLELTNLFPAHEAVIEMQDGAWKYRDWDDLYVQQVPDALKGQRLLTTWRGRAREAHLIGAFRTTPLPSSPEPDQIVLTWSDDPATTQTVQWRTDTSVEKGAVRYREKGRDAWRQITANRRVIEDRLLVNDRFIHHYTGVMKGLNPGTMYQYRVGNPDGDTWTDTVEFTTAPEGGEPFSFMCMADTHYTEESGKLLHTAFERDPDLDFYVIAGDIVSTGLYRNEWDHVFDYYSGVSERKPAIMALGNHDDQDGLGAWLPLALNAFPDNGPAGIEAGRTWSLRYGNALFLVLDVGTSYEAQAQWMDKQLAATDAAWKFVVYHFPLYSVEEDYPAIRKRWGEVFDRHHVDMAFHGHVHYYLRTKPMRDMKPVASPAEGTIHVISISQSNGNRPMPDAEHVAVRFTGDAVYPKIDIDGSRLHYRVYDGAGKLRDELVIEK